eukprot:8409969-Pyramimonas_sp.AAC.1
MLVFEFPDSLPSPFILQPCPRSHRSGFGSGRVVWGYSMGHLFGRPGPVKPAPIGARKPEAEPSEPGFEKQLMEFF